MTFLCLLTNPASYRALQSEIDAADSQGLLSSPIIRNSESRDHLPYLQAVIRESLRFWPPVACGVFYKTVPPGGDTLSGFYLPEGTKVSTVAGMLAMNRDQKLWGDDSECFRPERWLDADLEEERLRQMTKVVDINFAAGQFLCAGKGVALMQVNKVVPEVSTYPTHLPLCFLPLFPFMPLVPVKSPPKQQFLAAHFALDCNEGIYTGSVMMLSAVVKHQRSKPELMRISGNFSSSVGTTSPWSTPQSPSRSGAPSHGWLMTFGLGLRGGRGSRGTKT